MNKLCVITVIVNVQENSIKIYTTNYYYSTLLKLLPDLFRITAVQPLKASPIPQERLGIASIDINTVGYHQLLVNS
jgi:hypothetical protein